MLWITPYDEKVFGGTASSRRNFLDRIVANFDLNHTKRINDYNKLLKQRSKILKRIYRNSINIWYFSYIFLGIIFI